MLAPNIDVVFEVVTVAGEENIDEVVLGKLVTKRDLVLLTDGELNTVGISLTGGVPEVNIDVVLLIGGAMEVVLLTGAVLTSGVPELPIDGVLDVAVLEASEETNGEADVTTVNIDLVEGSEVGTVLFTVDDTATDELILLVVFSRENCVVLSADVMGLAPNMDETTEGVVIDPKRDVVVVVVAPLNNELVVVKPAPKLKLKLLVETGEVTLLTVLAVDAKSKDLAVELVAVEPKLIGFEAVVAEVIVTAVFGKVVFVSENVGVTKDTGFVLIGVTVAVLVLETFTVLSASEIVVAVDFPNENVLWGVELVLKGVDFTAEAEGVFPNENRFCVASSPKEGKLPPANIGLEARGVTMAGVVEPVSVLAGGFAAEAKLKVALVVLTPDTVSGLLAIGVMLIALPKLSWDALVITLDSCFEEKLKDIVVEAAGACGIKKVLEVGVVGTKADEFDD